MSRCIVVLLQAQDENDIEGKANEVAVAIVVCLAAGKIGGAADIAGLEAVAGGIARQARGGVWRRVRAYT